MKQKTFTKERMRATAIFLTDNDFKIWLAAAAVRRVSRAELLRQALRQKANEILSQSLSDQKVSEEKQGPPQPGRRAGRDDKQCKNLTTIT
jgi:hypothetical protein